jgi:tetratricopeptide (TPR) repeat protein
MSIFSRTATGAPRFPPRGQKRGKTGKAAADPQQHAEIGRLLQQGILLQESGKLWPAQQCYQSVLDLQADQPEALYLLGLLMMKVGQNTHAVEYLKRAAAAKPADRMVGRSYVEALILETDGATAERQLRRLLKQTPKDPDLLSMLACCHAMLGREERAWETFERVLTENPDHPLALTNYADFLIAVGEYDRAKSVYRRAKDLDIRRGEALIGLAKCETFQSEPPELGEIKSMLGRPDVAPTEAIRLSQAAAKICNDLDRHDDVFTFYAASKEILGSSYDQKKTAYRFERYKALFTAEFFAAHKEFGDPSPKPVFIVGMPRSGTTLTEQIIANHPRAAGAGEIGVVRTIADGLAFQAGDVEEYIRRVEALKRKDAARLAREGLDVLERFSKDAARITDKLPHTFELLGLAQLLFPRAKIVHCRRSPLDTCVSCYLSPLRGHPYADDLRSLGAYYRLYADLMEHWRKVLPASMLELDYEELIADPEQNARRLIKFIGLEWAPICLDFQSGERAVLTISRSQVRQPIYRTSVERWRRYEKHLGPLKEALGDLAY